MSLPRNHGTHPENRQSVGGYLYGKLGRLGLLSHMHTFQAKRPGFKGRRRAMEADDNIEKAWTLKFEQGCVNSGVLQINTNMPRGGS